MARSVYLSRISHLLLLLFSLHFLPAAPVNGADCASQAVSDANNKSFNLCTSLTNLDCSLHWNRDYSNGSLRVAFLCPCKESGWISWAINPSSLKMDGSQALIAYKFANGSLQVQTFNITGYGPDNVVPSAIRFEVSGTSAEYSNGQMRMFATLKLPVNMTDVNQVWQVGDSVVKNLPVKHGFTPENLNSMGRLDLLKGTATGGGGSSSRLRKKNIHGVLNAVSWGILMPIGIIIARYMRAFKSLDPIWFYLHASCQFSAYVIGVAGWVTGLQLGNKSAVTHTAHRNIGIALFCLASLQVFALFLRPNKENKYRKYWNYYHHSVGYAVIVLSIMNIFKGLDILDPKEKWKTAYIIVIAALGGIAALLEVVTWIIVLRKRSQNSTKPYDGSIDQRSRQ